MMVFVMVLKNLAKENIKESYPNLWRVDLSNMWIDQLKVCMKSNGYKTKRWVKLHKKYLKSCRK